MQAQLGHTILPAVLEAHLASRHHESAPDCSISLCAKKCCGTVLIGKDQIEGSK